MAEDVLLSGAMADVIVVLLEQLAELWWDGQSTTVPIMVAWRDYCMETARNIRELREG